MAKHCRKPRWVKTIGFFQCGESLGGSCSYHGRSRYTVGDHLSPKINSLDQRISALIIISAGFLMHSLSLRYVTTTLIFIRRSSSDTMVVDAEPK